MTVPELFAKTYRPTVITIVTLAAAAWGVVAAVGRFTSMVDQRAEAVVAVASAKPLAEHEEFKRRISQNESDIKGLIESSRQQNRVLDRLVAVEEERQRLREMPVRSSGIGR